MAVSCGLGQIQKSKLADDSEMITQLLRHVTSSPDNVDVKGDIFRHTIYPPSLVVIAFMNECTEISNKGWPQSKNKPTFISTL